MNGENWAINVKSAKLNANFHIEFSEFLYAKKCDLVKACRLWKALVGERPVETYIFVISDTYSTE